MTFGKLLLLFEALVLICKMMVKITFQLLELNYMIIMPIIAPVT